MTRRTAGRSATSTYLMYDHPGGPMGHLRLVDGLRAVAAGLVLVSHVAFWTGAANIDLVGGLVARGDAGVAVFFAISAFLLLRPAIARGLDGVASEPGSLWRYAVRRAARILPAYWLALAGVLAAAVWVVGSGSGGAGKVAAHLLVLQGYTREYYQSFTQTWSLTTEVTFYVLVPLLGAVLTRGLWRRGSRGVGTLVGLTLAVGGVGLVAQAAAAAWTRAGSDGGAGVLATSVLGHLAWFGAGTVVALLAEGHRRGVGPLATRPGVLAVWRSRPTLVLLAVVTYVLASSPIAGPRDLAAPTVGQAVVKEALYALFAFLLLAACVQEPRPGTPAAQVARWGVTRWLGDISYGVFLWHLVVLQVLFEVTGATLFATGFWWVLYAVVGFSVALASLSWMLVERPILTLARDRTARDRAARA
ncbi:acyltransferase [Aeromicrobium tamlense]|uniref:Acyltransferase n=1 Tax=Aeromicrobium tamlense TaxID=375541 RepID=A0A8I0FUS6_9ACTN|nr:acyltransferase [Aeromicrobium tamlense]MBD1270947.1 acyltransferase [Aeromicrobium tamlense]NYI38339.1 peptidoglycan/LPS O-acetylase OafA/YrhL [Aeromicrobium tamlense]